MFKLWSSFLKDWRILVRDRMGLALMFIMPIVLAIVIAMVQNSTFELVSNKKVVLLLLNRDTGEAAKQLETSLRSGGVFIVKQMPDGSSDSLLKQKIRDKDALLGLVIPEGYSRQVLQKAENVASRALQVAPLSAADQSSDSLEKPSIPAQLFYHPALQKSFRQGMDAALGNVFQMVQSKYIIRQLYSGINDSATIPANLEKQILANETPINQLPVSRGSSAVIPNATQHNIPAWTVFAMFFIVISLGSSIVREKTSGSFMRLKTMPTPAWLSVISKQITYILITILQAVVIFAIGRWIFPQIGLPPLNLPGDYLGLFLIVVVCGWCATSFGIFVGVFARTQEQSNGAGAISIVLFAAIGGLLVPAFAMPESFSLIMKFSPLYWCLEAFYDLFLEGGKLKDAMASIVPMLLMILVFQGAALIRMRRELYI